MTKFKVGDKVWSLNPQSNQAIAGVILDFKTYQDISNSVKALVDFNNHKQWIAIELLTRSNEADIYRKQ